MTTFVISNQYTTSATRAVIVHCALSDDSFIRCDNFNELHDFMLVPVGSVEYVLTYMQHKNIIQPALPYYPTIVDLPFDPYKRKIKLKTSVEVLNDFDRINKSFFIKPTKIKQFNGFVLNRLINSEHDIEQCKTLQLLLDNKNESFWVSEIVEFQSEVRFYISNKKIIGVGRYDDGSNKVQLPDFNVVEAIINKLWDHPYALDVGVLKTGETVIVEVTDAWAIGYYSDSYFFPELAITPTKYAKFLSDRWKSILEQHYA